MTDLQIVEKFAPPTRKSVVVLMIAVAIPLAAIVFLLYKRFGELVGQASGAAGVIALVMVLLTTMRRYGDEYYHARRRWRGLFMCRTCGQLVRPSR